ncbi:hypothetical protein J6590_081236 [Homalodisca vitripennis]|nr:hypothetical protein J6590_081236 [Homalodisca vitripennis]
MDVVPCSNNANDDVTTASYGWSQGITKHECNSQAHCDIIRGVCKTELSRQNQRCRDNCKLQTVSRYHQHTSVPAKSIVALQEVYVRLPCRYKTNDAMTTASYRHVPAKSIVALQEVYVRLPCRYKTNDAMTTASYGWSQGNTNT